MEIKNREKFIEYYIGVFEGLEKIGSTYFEDSETPEDKAKAAFDRSPRWNVQIVLPVIAKALDKMGCLNKGICPICGDHPVGSNRSWQYVWRWYNGTTLYLCETCFNQGKQDSLDIQKKYGIPRSRRKCYIATACYKDENCFEIIALKRFRDEVLNKNLFGKILINMYNNISPFFAKILINREKLNRNVKNYLLNPVVKKVIKYNSKHRI